MLKLIFGVILHSGLRHVDYHQWTLMPFTDISLFIIKIPSRLIDKSLSKGL